MNRHRGVCGPLLAITITLLALAGIGLSAATAAPTVQITYPETEHLYNSGISRAEGTAGTDGGPALVAVYVMLYYYTVGNYEYHYWNWTTQSWQIGSSMETMKLANGLESWKLESGFPTDWPAERTYALYARADDAAGNRGANVSYFYTGDDGPPSIDLNILRPTLRPPNHKLVLAAEVSVEDDNDPNPSVFIRVLSSGSDEPSKNPKFEPDSEIRWADGVRQIWLRSERDKKRTPRVYTIFVRAVDDGGRQSTALGTVTVP